MIARGYGVDLWTIDLVKRYLERVDLIVLYCESWWGREALNYVEYRVESHGPRSV